MSDPEVLQTLHQHEKCCVKINFLSVPWPLREITYSSFKKTDPTLHTDIAGSSFPVVKRSIM